MPEKLDFSKLEDQNKFEQLPEDEREKIFNETREDAAKIMEMVENNKATDYESANRMVEARKHWKNGHLGVTAEDHLAFGGSPDLELMHNEGKTLGELWSLEKILEKLMGLSDFLEKSRKEYKEKGPYDPNAHWFKDDILYAKKELRASIPYLKSIGKLPKKFENYEVNDLKDDPI